MTNYELQKLRDLPIVGVAERLGLNPKRNICYCPAHADKHPSLSLDHKRNRVKCWSCGFSAGTIDLVMKVLNTDFKDACRWLGDESYAFQVPSFRLQDEGSDVQKPFDASRYERFFAKPYLSHEALDFLYNVRKLDPRVVRWCRLTSWQDKEGTKWLQIPYYDTDGKLIGVQNRNLSLSSQTPQQDGNKGRRFSFPKRSNCTLYNLPIFKRLKEGDELWITEGCSDCWAALSSGKKALAIPSATLLSQKDKELLLDVSKRLSLKWKMAPDRDVPGESLFLQLKEILPNLERIQLPPGCKDFSDYYVMQMTNQRKET